MAGQVVRAQNHSGLQHDASHHEFTPLGIRYSEDRHFANRGMFVDDRFDLGGVNIFATCDDHVFQAVKDVEIAVGIPIADVSRTKHSVSKCESGVLRIVPVAPHDIGAPCDQFPLLPDFHFLSCLVLDSQVNSWTGPPTGYELALDMFLIFKTREEAGLAEPIALEKFHVRQKLSGATDKFRRHWRTAISQNLEAAQVIRLCFRHLRQQVQHSRHQDRVSYAFALDQLTETLRAELWNRDLARTESWCCEHGGKIGNVKNRCRMQIDTAFSVSHPIAEVVDVRQDVGVTHHDALRPARRATGIDECQNRFRVINRIWTGLIPDVEGLFIEHDLPLKLHGRSWE